MSEPKTPDEAELTELEPLEPVAELIEEAPPESAATTMADPAPAGKAPRGQLQVALPGTESRELEKAPQLLQKAATILVAASLFPWMLGMAAIGVSALAKLVMLLGAWVFHQCMAHGYGDKAAGFAKSLGKKVIPPKRRAMGWNVGELLGLLLMAVALLPIIDAAVLGDETVLGIKNAILKSSQEKGILALGLITLVHIYAYSKGATFNPIVPILFLGPALAGVISLTSGKYGWWTLGAVGGSFAGILAVYTLGVALKEAKVEGDAKRKAAQEARVAARKQRKSGAGDSETPS